MEVPNAAIPTPNPIKSRPIKDDVDFDLILMGEKLTLARLRAPTMIRRDIGREVPSNTSAAESNAKKKIPPITAKADVRYLERRIREGAEHKTARSRPIINWRPNSSPATGTALGHSPAVTAATIVSVRV
jgi:hypothetical protein